MLNLIHILISRLIRRGNSTYLPNYVIPMLPEKLSNGICSLNPNVERLAFVADLEVKS